ncbi:permease [Maritimibacter sp. 55A14]|uniref:permease n=1 Tax=Maritimibacter sp. 55A14 TaxID=2174844 RepID=UPI000D603F27|nr:permease [Maritimibacter sp. 55A14]PWE29459.1 permease [Maritimibacter sp. 55A14]
MTDLSTHLPALARNWRRVDKVWLLIALLLALVWAADPARLPEVAGLALEAFAGTLPFIAFAVLAIGYLKATGSEGLIARAFEGREVRMIVLAAAMGGLAPFCSCEVIPFIAALLAAGAPLSAAMAFWLASPLMDPAMFAITAGTLGLDFAIAKTVFAIAIGLGGGFAVMALGRSPLYADPLKPRAAPSCGCGGPGLGGPPVWRFWQERDRRAAFGAAATENALFLAKWLGLAYVLEALMILYVPTELIAGLLGGEGLKPVLMGALIGGPAYLNGYAAPPLVAGLLEQGMAPGAAMSFVVAGGVSCIPAAVAVWALVRGRVFASYILFATIGSIAAGLAWAALA